MRGKRGDHECFVERLVRPRFDPVERLIFLAVGVLLVRVVAGA
jgi:hypothetical protein